MPKGGGLDCSVSSAQGMSGTWARRMSRTQSSTSGSGATRPSTLAGRLLTKHLLPAAQATNELGAEGCAERLGLALDRAGRAADLASALVVVDGVAEEDAGVDRAALHVDARVAGVAVAAEDARGDLRPLLGLAVDVQLEGLGDRPARGRDHHVGVVDGCGERVAAAAALGPDAPVALHLHVDREASVGDPPCADHERTPPGRRRTATVWWRVEWCRVSWSAAGPVQSHSEPS